MIGASAWLAAWLLLLTVAGTTAPGRAPALRRRRAATDDGGCRPPLRRVEMFDVDLGTTGYRLREIHVRHAVKVRIYSRAGFKAVSYTHLTLPTIYSV